MRVSVLEMLTVVGDYSSSVVVAHGGRRLRVGLFYLCGVIRLRDSILDNTSCLTAGQPYIESPLVNLEKRCCRHTGHNFQRDV